MVKMKQKEAVLKAIAQALSESNRTVTEGEKVELTKEERAKVIELLFNGFKAGEVQLDVEYSDADLKAYTSSLLNNWLRKAKELNGGARYQAKNPGSRAGQQDDMLKNLRNFLKAKQASQAPKEEISQIQAAIDSRVNEIRATKTKIPEFNVDLLPESLRGLAEASA